MAAAVLLAATAAVPWPITITRRSDPSPRRARRAAGRDSSPSRTDSLPPESTILPLSVLRNELGDWESSLSR